MGKISKETLTSMYKLNNEIIEAEKLLKGLNEVLTHNKYNKFSYWINFNVEFKSENLTDSSCCYHIDPKLAIDIISKHIEDLESELSRISAQAFIELQAQEGSVQNG